MIGNKKIFCLKFADDIAAIADSREGLQSMLIDLEKFSDRNGMSVNTEKTKIMVFQKGGRRKKSDKWVYKGEELEVVREYKYLGFWFSTKNAYSLHIRRMAAKVKKAINMVWGLWKRARLNNLSRRLYLLDTIAKSGCLYGAEIWGWDRWEEVERVQGRYTKMAMGVNQNTPSYIWRLEAGRNSLEIETRRRAGNYLEWVAEMEEERWPKICLKEELRGIKNGMPTKWGNSLKKAFEEVGDGEELDWILRKEMKKEAETKREQGLKFKIDQETQLDWHKVDNSRFCEGYKEWKKKLGREHYWENRKWDGKTKEQWARLRCGSVGRSKCKGFVNDACRFCEVEAESLEHIWICQEAKKEIKEDWVREVENRGLIGTEEIVKRNLREILGGDPIEELCSYSREFEKKC